MRTTVRHVAVAAVLVVGVAAGRASGQGVTDQGGSIIMVPKVIVDTSRDTVIQLVNISNSLAHAHCFYVNAALTDPQSPPGPLNPPLWTEIDFNLSVTAQQPVYWVASAGRTPTLAAIDPGAVPPVSSLPFTGELVCVQVDAASSPISSNSLIGEAEITDRSSGDVAKYSAYGLRGLDTNNQDNTLCIGGNVSNECPSGAEYEACPGVVVLEHMAEGAEDQLAGPGSSVHTEITVVPCAHDFENQIPTTTTLQFHITNEFEQPFAASTTVTCWATTTLSGINSVFNSAMLGSDFAQTRIAPVTGSGDVVVVAQEFHSAGGAQASVAANTHIDGASTNQDLIVVPAQ